MATFLLTPKEELKTQSSMVYSVTMLWTVVVCLIVSMGFIFFPALWGRWAALIGVSLAVAAICLTLNRFGYTQLASITLVCLLWLQITVPCLTAGGIMAPGIIQQMSVILTAGFLLGWRGGACWPAHPCSGLWVGLPGNERLIA